jgi:hypothetical protein
MIRQCAWCLHLIDDAGERISPLPLPKLYEVSHGMCTACGSLWLEQVLSSYHEPGPVTHAHTYQRNALK